MLAEHKALAKATVAGALVQLWASKEKMKRLFLPFLLIVAFSGITYGQSGKTDKEEKHPIDQRLADCLDVSENQTTVGMVHCAEKAAEEWDKELNKYYKLLMGVLSTSEKELLKQAQRKWLEYRDQDYKFSAEMYYNLQGTMWRMVAADRKASIIKDRALALKTYYEIFAESK